MERFMYVFRGGHDSPPSPEEMQAQMAKWGTWMGSLGEAGKLEGGEPLTQEGRMMKSGGSVVTDGPFAEGSEVVGGYVIIKAESFEEAIELSKGCPMFDFEDGTVEVRQIQKMDI